MNVEELLNPVSAAAPCGKDLEYGAVDVLTRAAQIVPEQQIGDTVVPAKEPEWEDVYRKALEICKETKDLRIAVILVNAATRTKGWPEFADSLKFLDGLLERYWAAVHPQLDPDEPDDFTMRVNVIAALADDATTIHYLREAPLIQSVMGRFSLRDVLIAEGETSHPAHSEEPTPDRALIDAAIRAANADDLEQVNTAINESAQTLSALEARLMSLVGAGSAPNLSPLSSLIVRARKIMTEGLALRPDAISEPVTDIEAEGAIQRADATVRPQVGGPGEPISGPDDVRRILEDVCAYYRKHEPSSPIPILLNRALRLISKDFEDLMKNLAPDGLKAIEQLRGPSEDGADR